MKSNCSHQSKGVSKQTHTLFNEILSHSAASQQHHSSVISRPRTGTWKWESFIKEEKFSPVKHATCSKLFKVELGLSSLAEKIRSDDELCNMYSKLEELTWPKMGIQREQYA
ncbi:ADP-ribosylation factor GTPase-activating protein 3 [Trichinella spiralis]|uniref:ADP-ribosylation factor GTPase-activating protein 3 n=1 Tax=Trichinella spiralis TaxID=6334 RepID=UPI0001EFEE1C|nr:ADP-ribosylation factor GTPase-activating protein 3 [Trichinella spiralis]